jgi:ATP-binding cassette subfamily C (CFTR/MRP) protein 1
MADTSCDQLADRLFGPTIKCSQFDFTLTFEQSIFGIGISALFLLWFPLKIWRLHGGPIKTLTNPIYISKIVWNPRCIA